MRSLDFGLVLLGVAVGLAAGCGSSTGDEPTSGGAAGHAIGGSSTSNAGSPTGIAGEQAKAGAPGAGSSQGGSAFGGSAPGGSAAGGANMGGMGGQSEAQAGASNEAGSPSALVDCDPSKIMCKRAAPACGVGEVPSVNDVGNCYGDCVKIERCACSAAAQCPDQNQYTCWAKQHCGPFVQ